MSRPPNAQIHTDQPPDQRVVPFAETKVALWYQNKDRAPLIKQIISSCTAVAREIKDSSDLEGLECSAGQSVALVALGASSSEQTKSLHVIRALRLKGFKVICYEDRVLSWPIGMRCRALLSGSSLLLDSSVDNFSQQLRQVLARCLETETEEHLEEQRIKKQMNELGIIGESSKMTSVFRWVVRVSALSDFPVLINGETGTGKELIANALHRLDAKRANGPFLAANCGAISSGLAESELFGHRRGAFTGADTDRKGLFRSAEGGVLFLDEIGELNESLQAKLLRVLQEKRVLGVGFDHEVSLNVRVIAATNRSLEQMVEQGTFREDLYHRLNVLSVNIPPLRERLEDLQPLTQHFLNKYSSLNEEGARSVNPEFVEALRQVDLSGNARQLENIVRRALLNKADDSPLGLSDLAPAVWEQLSIDVKPAASHTDEGQSPLFDQPQFDAAAYFRKILASHDWNLSKSLDYCEKFFLKCALQLARGNQSQTARLIGITPRSVYNKVHKHRLAS